jgi:hypothetical protein
MRRSIGIVFVFLASLVASRSAAAAAAPESLSIKVEIGWGDGYRVARWNPVFITLSDASPRAVLLEVYSAHAGNTSMLVHQRLSIGPVPAVFPIYLPLTQSADETFIVVRDAQSERRLLEWPDETARQQLFFRNAADAVLIGTSGRGPALQSLQPILGQFASVRALDPARLPVVATGYDALSVLVLNQPDWNRISAEQQTAIVNWLRAGGRMILWPGPDPVPQVSPLVNVLPARIGDNVTFAIAAAQIDQAGLSNRFARLPGRTLVPADGTTRLPLLGAPDLFAVRGRVGFGQILLLPVDPSLFSFNDADAAKRFWQPILQGILTFDEKENAQSYGWNDPVLTRHAAATNAVMDLLGDVPGIGAFGFGYVATVLIGLMIIVGPVDWIVLKLLGRQPWTWFTTTGWIALITTGAIFIGYIFKSGDLYYRTFRLIDQADGSTVAATDMLALYSPRTRLYDFAVDPQGWWQPAGDARFSSRGGLRSDVGFHQDYQGNRPEPTLVNVWNLRFLQGETIASGPPVIDASLKIDGNRIVGTITNRLPRPLRDLVILTKTGHYAISQSLPPGESAQIGATLITSWTPPPTWTWFDLASRRSERIDELMRSGADIAVVYASVESPAPAVKLAQPGAIEAHWDVVRALVPISTGEQKP